MRVKIFIDFWNYQLAWNEYHRAHGASGVVKIPWNPRLYEVLVSSIDKTAVYAGTHVFASFDPLSKKDLQLRKFLDYYDRAMLVAGDADHVPAVEFLGARMKQVTHAWFKGHANELRNACWNHVYFEDLMPALTQ